MKKLLLLVWYLLGCFVGLPALVFIIISRWLGIRAEQQALRAMTREDINFDDKDKKS